MKQTMNSFSEKIDSLFKNAKKRGRENRKLVLIIEVTIYNYLKLILKVLTSQTFIIKFKSDCIFQTVSIISAHFKYRKNYF